MDSSTHGLSIENNNTIGIDIGGTLAKVAIWYTSAETETKFSKSGHQYIKIEDVGSKNGKVALFKFQTAKIDELISFIKEIQIDLRGNRLHCTGGGAHKFSDKFQSELGVETYKCDEMASLQIGANFVLSCIEMPSFTYSRDLEDKVMLHKDTNVFPFLLVNIGSGVSVLRAKSPTDFQRVGGTPLGGGTLLGIAKYLIKCETYEELIEISKQGDNKNVDLYFSDFYKGDHTPFEGIDMGILAASFGKVAMGGSQGGEDSQVKGIVEDGDTINGYKKADIAKSLINMIAYNIAQIAYLHAKLDNLNRIYFIGNFIKDYHYTMDRIDFGLNFWSKGEIQARFIGYDGYFGALGTLFENVDISQANTT
eukprot:CAMPEP_0114974066 /NCGR_PEP_ID=MMETSP0216-20121206/1315_1 /TAXON_ID=223996 /ORGANISM="Protocruzia adherens, Strain Boccale" /LENGTH=365 /DNA_ID=CAMNT_0002334651 /DNA_START=37 /DNA_END=1134 /DNA_ORIENTATION=+